MTDQTHKALFSAVSAGDLTAVRTALAEEGALSACNHFQQTALHIAADNGHDSIVAFLIGVGANVAAKDAADMTPLHLACRFGHVSTVQLLLLHSAALTGRVLRDVMTVAAMTVDRKPEIVNAISRAIQRANVREAIPEHPNPDTPNGQLLLAAAKGDVVAAKQALSSRANPNACDQGNRSALAWAAAKGHQEALDCLLAAGADVDHQSDEGWSPLMDAAAAGNVEAVQSLLSAGADVAVSNRAGGTALRYASEMEEAAIVQLLLEAVADPKSG